MNKERTALIATGACLGYNSNTLKDKPMIVDWTFTIWTEEDVKLDSISKRKQKVLDRKEEQDVISIKFKVPFDLYNQISDNNIKEQKLIGSTKPMVIADKFPHQFDVLADSFNNTIEDNLKFNSELSHEICKTPEQKWNAYKGMCCWVSVCERLGIKITNKEEVFVEMNRLWQDIKKSEIYKRRQDNERRTYNL